MTPGDEEDEEKLRQAMDEKYEADKAELEDQLKTDVERWQALHGGKGLPLCTCNHDPPCPACKASIEAGGNRCGCVKVRLREAVREAETLLQNAQGQVEEAVATLWQIQDHQTESPSEILRCALQGLSQNMQWVDHQFETWQKREGLW